MTPRAAATSPRPWRVVPCKDERDEVRAFRVVDALGARVVRFPPTDRANAELVASRVNGCEILRALVSDLAACLERRHLCGEPERALLRRAASAVKGGAK